MKFMAAGQPEFILKYPSVVTGAASPPAKSCFWGKWVTVASLPLLSIGNGLVRKGDHGQLPLFGSLQAGQRAMRKSGRCITVKRLTSHICIPSLYHLLHHHESPEQYPGK